MSTDSCWSVYGQGSRDAELAGQDGHHLGGRDRHRADADSHDDGRHEGGGEEAEPEALRPIAWSR